MSLVTKCRVTGNDVKEIIKLVNNKVGLIFSVIQNRKHLMRTVLRPQNFYESFPAVLVTDLWEESASLQQWAKLSWEQELA